MENKTTQTNGQIQSQRNKIKFTKFTKRSIRGYKMFKVTNSNKNTYQLKINLNKINSTQILDDTFCVEKFTSENGWVKIIDYKFLNIEIPLNLVNLDRKELLEFFDDAFFTFYNYIRELEEVLA